MKLKQILALALCASVLMTTIPTAVFAAKDGPPCENHPVHTADCGYREEKPGQPCQHTADCYTDKLICSYDVEEINTTTDSDALASHEHTQECYALDCPHERGEHDDTCGYAEAVPGSACTHTCELCSQQNSRSVPDTFEQNVKNPETNEAIMPFTVPTPYAEPIAGSGYSFNPDDGTLTVSSNDGTTAWRNHIDKTAVTNAVLESGVTSIGDSAFSGCKNLNEVTLPDDLTSIGKSAFYDCENIELTKLPSGLKSIGNSAFLDCAKLALTELPSGLKSIGTSAFWKCANIALAELPSGLESIESSTFLGCTNITLTKLPDGVKSIGSGAFQDCSNITLTKLPDGVKSIGSGAFKNCTNIALTELPDGVTSIGDAAFYGCSSIVLTELPSGLTSIENKVFYGCKNIELTELPDGVTSIGTSAFQDCTNLALKELPSDVTDIGYAAFRNCTNLALTELPSGVTSIEGYAFFGCKNIELTQLPSGVTSIGDSAFQGCSKLALTELPDGVTSIKNYTFNGCSKLALTKLPSGVTSIDYAAFNGCISLTSLDIPISTAPTLGNFAFERCNIIIFVPYGASGYTADNKWPENRVVYGAALDKLTVSGAPLSPTFFPGTEAYTLKGAEDLETVTVTPTAHNTESIFVNGKSVGSGAASDTIALEPDKDNVIEVHVKNDDTDKRTYTITIPRAALPITIAAIEGVTAPTRGAVPVTAVTETDQYTGTVTWSPAIIDGKFADDTEYTATITLTPKTGYTFTGVEKDFFTVAGTKPDGVTNAAGSGTVTAVFPATKKLTNTGDGNSSGGGSSPSRSLSSSSYDSRTLVDINTGVKVEGKSIHESAALTVIAGGLHTDADTDCDLLRKAQKDGLVLSVYDVSLSRTFLGNVTVYLPVEGRDGQTLTVAQCINGKPILTNVKVSGGYVEVKVDVLSTFTVLNDVYTLESLSAPIVENPFTDVKKTDWFYPAVMYVYQQGLMNGTTTTSFAPNQAVTRAQPPTILYRLEGSPDVTELNPFADVRAGQWYTDGVIWAAGAGLVDGYDGYKVPIFGPADSVTREQLATILYRYAQYKEWDVSQRDDLMSYTDSGDISAWAREAVQWACGSGIIHGNGGKLNPKAGATRAELAGMLQRMLEKYN